MKNTSKFQNVVIVTIVGWLVLFVFLPNLMIIGTSFLTRDDAPRDKCTLSCAINGIHAAFHYLKKNYISGCVMTVPTG